MISNDDDEYVQAKVTTFYRAKNDLGQLRICRDYCCRNLISHGAKTVGVEWHNPVMRLHDMLYGTGTSISLCFRGIISNV